jgi:hypothetical protein
MKYVLLRTVGVAFHHGLLFIPLHYTYVNITSSLQFTSFNFTSPRFTAFFFLRISTRPSFHVIHRFPNPLPTLLGLQERVPEASAGSWFQSSMVLFTKECFPISLLYFAFKVQDTCSNTANGMRVFTP